MAANIEQIPIPQLYKQVNHITTHGIEGYHVKKKYEDPLEMMKSRQLASGSAGKLKKYETKRGNYLDDEANAHKIVPGPGKYKFADEWPQKSKSLHPPIPKKTYIQQLMEKEKKEKKPAPGHYNTFKSQKEIEAQKKILASKKIKVNDRITYLDHIEYESLLTPGVGAYNPRKRVVTEVGKIKTNPQQWRKKHAAQEKKKPPKLPDMGSYNPLPSTYLLFQNSNKIKNNNKNLLGKVDRFKTEKSGSGLGPGKYVSIQQWRGKQVKKQRHGLQSISKGISKSVYYH